MDSRANARLSSTYELSFWRQHGCPSCTIEHKSAAEVNGMKRRPNEDRPGEFWKLQSLKPVSDNDAARQAATPQSVTLESIE